MQCTVIVNASDVTLKGHVATDDMTLKAHISTEDGALHGHISTKNKTLKGLRTSWVLMPPCVLP